MRAIDIWVHISQGWQVPRLALSLSCRFLIFLAFDATRRDATQQFSSQRSAAAQYAGPRELCPPFVNHLDVPLIGRPLLPRKEQQLERRGDLCEGKPLTSPPFSDYTAGSRTNGAARWVKVEGRQIECSVCEQWNISSTFLFFFCFKERVCTSN